MGPHQRCRIPKVACGLPSLLRSVTLFAAAAATAAVVTGAAESTSVASSGAAARSIIMPQDGNVRLHRSAPLNLVERQPLDGFEPSAIRRLQRQRRKSQHVAVSAGLVAVACLAVAFVVFQCARKALFPRLFGSPGKRALSDSDSEEHSVDVCIEEEIDESEERSGGAEARPTEEEGEATAVEALGQLRYLITLGVQTAPYVPLDSRAVLTSMLLTICAQEVALLGVYSTPQTEVERKSTIDFVVAVGQQALSQLENEGASFRRIARGRGMLKLLERLRTAPANADSEGLAVEATISAYRIKQCIFALEQLQHWVKYSLLVPEEVLRKSRRLLARVRHSSKRRVLQDAAASAWIYAEQVALNFFGIDGPAHKRRPHAQTMSFSEEMDGRRQRYERLARGLVESVNVALGRSGPGQEMQEHHQQQPWQQQSQGTKRLQQQRHPATSQDQESIAGFRLLRRGEQLAAQTTPEGGVPSDQSRDSDPPRRRSPSATTPHLPGPSRPQRTRPRTETHQRAPTAHRGRPQQASPWSAPSRQRSLQETREQEQPSPDSSTVDSNLRAEAPEFRPRDRPAPGAQQHVAPMSFAASGGWPAAAPPPSGFALPHQPADPSIAPHSDPAFPRPLWMPPQHHTEHPVPIFPQPAPAPHTLQPVEHLQSAPQALPGPFYYPPGPLMPTGGPSPVFPGSMFQPPPPGIPQQGFTHPHALPGGWQHVPVRWVFASPGALHSSGGDISLQMIGSGPPRPVTVQAGSTTDGTWTGGAGQGQPGGVQWQLLPPSHPPADQYASGISVETMYMAPMPTQSEGEGSSADATVQMPEGAEGSVGEAGGDGSTQG